ncbi:MAG TPA: ATP-binding protein [Rhizomicrobium sp.]|nr:ATP-binding protein [Rhizomicrobium sp.]
MRRPIHTEGQEALSDVARQQLRSYGVILGVFVFLLVAALMASWSAIKIVDSTRAYVTGEGRYSKAEKIAVLSLHRYAYSARPDDYARFLAAVNVPRGDHMARVALQNAAPDLKAAKHGFLQGENHPADIAGMIKLFRWFSWWQPFAAAVSDWREGDRLVSAMIAEGRELHWMVTRHDRNKRVRARLLDRIDHIDDQLTLLENRFSAHLGDAARMATGLVVFGLSAMTVLLWAMGTILAARLVTRQLALGNKLESSERRFRHFADIASDWYWEMDAGGIVTYVSERFSTIVGGAPADSVLGMDADKFIRESAVVAEQREAYLTAVLNQREFRGIQLEIKEAQGTSRYWSVSARPHFDAREVFLGYRGVGSDITGAVHDELMLREAKVRAEIANRAKSEFLANMSHELRTPLNAILGFSDIIAEQSLGPEAVERYSEYALDIHKSGRHLLAIIDDILDLAKIEAGRSELAESEVPLSRLMDMFQTFLGHRFLECGIAFEIDIPDDAPAVWIDKRKFAQIIINLLSNALKFTPRGGKVMLASRRNDDGTLAISVRDTGIGIAREDLPMVLAPFGQVESAFSRKHHGAGLGLPLARSLTELHGGTLTIESELGIGTTATVTLPAIRVVGAPVSDEVAPRQATAR